MLRHSPCRYFLLTYGGNRAKTQPALFCMQKKKKSVHKSVEVQAGFSFPSGVALGRGVLLVGCFVRTGGFSWRSKSFNIRVPLEGGRPGRRSPDTHRCQELFWRGWSSTCHCRMFHGAKIILF